MACGLHPAPVHNRPRKKEPPLYETVTDEGSLKRWVDSLQNSKRFAVDTETTSKDPIEAELVGVSLAVHDGFADCTRACYIPVGHTTGEQQLPLAVVLKALKPVLEGPVVKVLHNAVYDMVVLRNYDIELQNIDDTQMMSYVLDGKTFKHWHGMDDLAPLHLGRETISFNEVVIPELGMTGFQDVRLNHATEYAAEDADNTLELYDVLYDKLHEARLLSVYTGIDRPALRALADMKWNGIAVSTKRFAELEREWTAEKLKAEKAIFKLAGDGLTDLKPNSLRAFLFGTDRGQLGLEPLKTTKEGTPSVDAEVLEALDDEHEAIKLIQTWAKFSKLLSTYVIPLQQTHPVTGRVHTELKHTFTNTARLSSEKPNLQNIPTANNAKHANYGEMIRNAFIAPRGYKLVCADYSQIELRVLAHISGDRTLINAFLNGLDPHGATATEIFGVTEKDVDATAWGGFRRKAKTINFGVVYGITEYGLSKQLKVDPDEAKDYIDRYLDRLPGVRQYIDDTKAFARAEGYTETEYGRRINQEGIHSRNRAAVGHAERAAINAPIQGTAADIIRRAMGKVPYALDDAGLEAKLLLQVHDELIFEVPDNEVEETERVAKHVMETCCDDVDWLVPILADVKHGQSWHEAH